MKSVAELLDLTGKTAIVTGGAAGIGQAISRRLAEAGASVLIADINGEGARLAAKELSEAGYRAEGTTADVADEFDVCDVIDEAVRLFGGVDILVNNAGIYPNVPLAELEPGTFDRVVAVNLRGVYLFTKFASELMKKQGHGGRRQRDRRTDALRISMMRTGRLRRTETERSRAAAQERRRRADAVRHPGQRGRSRRCRDTGHAEHDRGRAGRRRPPRRCGPRSRPRSRCAGWANRTRSARSSSSSPPTWRRT